ncbi:MULTISPECIES: prepilin-type N-terminal cleavage/methylation domain-containing protein [Vibrio]|uniref:Type II secretion system protein n=2 Tax=Vibrio tasmaniensis TaxID=212663 RepID=A0AB38NR02_9VIBR|nr:MULTISPECIES: type II secretion system protein [Vibrio]TKG31927.1 type II secretion system protein [Vibrio tasmaniensis]TKG41881.1 type II secretion system protein [Vibrio tasmaniensis]TKG45861.1 type II secretion system protein [Vibrio tasmaniensis]TKG48953.1 type II secretion system protein [Vibrio tasmaniensis]TKG53137.1 type II secretion system protein [Vibrio tasmaniensis]
MLMNSIHKSPVKERGFTLIESVIVIVIMGLAMMTIINFLAPQVSRSGDPHYQTRSAALGQSVMSMILARGFDENSDFDGGEFRCGEGASGVNCTAEANFGPEEADIALYNDVDDYDGCWEPGATNGCRDLNLLLDENGATTYRNYRLDVDVTYQMVDQLKRINLTISASNYPPIVLDAYRGNY